MNEQAIYGELSYDFGPQFSATIGARAFHDTVAITDFGDAYLDGGPNTVHNSASYTSASPKFVLSYKPADDFMYYIQVSKGFRSGQGNLTNGYDPLTGTPIPRFYGPDSLWNYEIGAKTSPLDGRLTLNGDVYDIQWSQIQLQELSPSGFNYTANAYSSREFSNLDNAASLHYGNVGLANAHNRVNAFEFLGVPTQVLQEPRTIGLTVRWNY